MPVAIAQITFCFFTEIANALRNGATGSFVSFRDCVFERNVAVEYGGAVGLIVPSHNVIFDNRAEIVPVQFHNW